jgi:transposase
MTTDNYVAYIGIDWADRKHDIALYDCASGTWQESIIQTRPQDLLDWVNHLRARYGEGEIAVGMEQKRGPLLYALCQYDNLVLFPINPRTVANYRKAFQPSRAKSDPVDARLLVELMQKHPDKLERWVAGCPQTRALRQWVESRRMLVGEKVRLTHRITASLKSYFPQVLDWFEDKDTLVFCEFIEQFSQVQTAQAATPQQLIQFFHAHKVTRKSAINRRIQQIQEAGPPLTTDASIIVPAQALTRALIALLKVILNQLADFNAQIATLFEALPDAELFSSLPGAGPDLAPRLLVAFGAERNRFSNAQAFMSYVGIAPVKEESGKKRWVHWQASPEEGFPSVGNWRDGLARFFSGKLLSNGSIKPDASLPGRKPFTSSKSDRENLIKKRFGHWLTSGAEFFGAVGKVIPPRMRRNTWRHWHGKSLLSSSF